MASDLVGNAVAFIVALRLLSGAVLKPTSLVAIPLIVFASKALGLYDRDEVVMRKTTLDECPLILGLAAVWTLLAWFGQSILLHGSLHRIQALVLWATLTCGVLLARALSRWLVRTLLTPERCLFIGDLSAGRRIAHKLAIGSGIKATLIAALPLGDEPGHSGEHLSERDFRDMLETLDIDRVIIAPTLSHEEEVLDWIRRSKAVGAKVSLLPRMLETVGSSVEFDDLNGLPVLGVRRFGLSRSSFASKRGFDLVGSLILLIFLAPMMAVISLAIKLDSSGPVFFRQTRIGRDGRPFRIFKFRTMVREAEDLKDALRALNEADGLFKIADDPRITRVGKWLRRLSLDELPQLMNVVRGDMSLVGPRPLVSEDDARVEGYYRTRLHLTPGMTGHWQILGSARIPLEEMVMIDYLYVANWSLWGDVKILLRTVPYLLGGRGM